MPDIEHQPATSNLCRKEKKKKFAIQNDQDFDYIKEWMSMPNISICTKNASSNNIGIKNLKLINILSTASSAPKRKVCLFPLSTSRSSNYGKNSK